MTVHTPVTARLAPLAGRLSPLLGKLGSPHNGEVVAAARAVGRLLKRQGLGWNDFALALAAEPVRVVHAQQREPPPPAEPDWLHLAEFCAARVDLLNEREAGFVASMCTLLRRGIEPSPRQAAWLVAIHHRINEETTYAP